MIKGITETKEAEKKKELEKLNRGDSFRMLPKVEIPDPQPVLEMHKQSTIGSPMKKGSIASQATFDIRSEHEKEKEADKEEIKKYGVIFILLIKTMILEDVDLGVVLQ